MKKEILIADNIDNIYDEINALIREKKTNVKKVVAEELNRKASGFEKYIDQSGVGIVKIPSVKPERFDTGNPNNKVITKTINSFQNVCITLTRKF